MAFSGMNCPTQTGQGFIMPRKFPGGTDNKVEKVEEVEEVEEMEGSQKHLNLEVPWESWAP